MTTTEPMTTAAWLADAGVTYRQLDYWTRQGWLRPATRDGGSGPGYARRWPAGELEVAGIMARLVLVGFMPAAAAPIARARAFAEDPMGIDVGAGISVHIE